MIDDADRSASAIARTRRGRRQMLLILAICAAPVVLGTLAFYLWEGAGRTNYGELLAPRAVDLAGRDDQGRERKLSDLRGSWALVVIDSGACDENCRRKLLYTRQVRLAQGREQDRMERVWLIDDGIAPAREQEGLHAGAHVLRVESSAAAAAFAPSGESRTFIYLVDPQGFLMMRYPSDPDPKKMIKDLQRLLKYTPRKA
jgi:cytochrome oxidase Cu insertion factor (SCO1/SenC/PrrC family)